ncbi:hypothetical protein HZS_1660 [Henneguya salminicola]|nr:hypothetical protein HZS_1660 [Henneguya salminicola]
MTEDKMISNSKLTDQCQILGGEGQTVEIDEAKFGRRKYERGALVQGVWLITQKNGLEHSCRSQELGNIYTRHTYWNSRIDTNFLMGEEINHLICIYHRFEKSMIQIARVRFMNGITWTERILFFSLFIMIQWLTTTREEHEGNDIIN